MPRKKPDSVTKHFRNMNLRSPRKNKGERTPSTQQKKRPKLVSSHTSPPRVGTTQCPSSETKHTPLNPRRYIAPTKPCKKYALRRTLSAVFVREPHFPVSSPSRSNLTRRACETTSPLFGFVTKSPGQAFDRIRLDEPLAPASDKVWDTKDYIQLMSSLKRTGFRMLAIDWDNTLVEVHTKSNWYHDAKSLALWLRDMVKS